MCGKPVPGATNGLYKAVMPGGAEYFSQAADMDVDGAIFHVGCVPDLLEQLLTTVDTFLVRHEEMQQAEFPW